jgi:hypothetical protein
VLEEQAAAEVARKPVDEELAADLEAYPNFAHGVSVVEKEDSAARFEFGLDALVIGIAAKMDGDRAPSAGA